MSADLALTLALWAVLVLPAAAAVGLLVRDLRASTTAAGRRHRAVRERGPTGSRAIAGAATVLATLAATAVVWWRPEAEVPWIPALGVRLHLGVDGVSAPFLLLTVAVATIAVLLPTRADTRAPEDADGAPADGAVGTYRACLLAVSAAASLAFLSRDAVVFVVAMELTLLPMWWLIRRHGDPTPAADRRGAATRYLLYGVIGSTLTVVGVLALVVAGGSADLDVLAATTPLGAAAQTGAAAVLLLGLAIKVPVWPLHSWLPWAHSTAPTAASVLLAAVLLKLGTYGLIRLVAGPLPEGLATLAPVLAGLGVLGLVWAGLACLVERDLKRLIAWSSVAHMGFVALAVAAGGQAGIQAAVFGSVAHGLVAALLFVVVGALKDRWGSADLTHRRAAVREVAPRLGWGLVVGVAALIGVPGLAVFWGELSALLAAWGPAAGRTGEWFRVLAALGVLGAVLGAAYGVRVLREVWAGDRVEPRIRDAGRVEALAIGLLTLALLVLGVLPSLVLDVSAPDVARMLGVLP